MCYCMLGFRLQPDGLSCRGKMIRTSLVDILKYHWFILMIILRNKQKSSSNYETMLFNYLFLLHRDIWCYVSEDFVLNESLYKYHQWFFLINTTRLRLACICQCDSRIRPFCGVADKSVDRSAWTESQSLLKQGTIENNFGFFNSACW